MALRLSFKWILIFEALFAGIYISLTKGLFVIYLTSIGQSVEQISFVVLISSFASLLIGLIMYRNPSFITRRVKPKLVTVHALERFTWMLMPLTTNIMAISALYSTYMVLSFLISTFIAFSIYGSLAESSIREVTAKRTAANGLSSILGFVLGVFLLALLPAETKFAYIFTLGALVGLLSTILIVFIDLSHLEGVEFPKTIEQPEKIFSTSTFLIILMSASNLLGIIWTPYVMNYLGGPDYLAASMNLAGTLASVTASIYWRNKSFKALRSGLALNALGPAIILAAPWPLAHVPISVYTSFTYTGANFLGVFLFANYNRWFGAVRSGILLGILGNLAQLIAAFLGFFARENFTLALLAVLAIKILAFVAVAFTVPEAAVVPEYVARSYSQILYNSSLTGYRLSIEISKETILTIFRLLALSLVITALVIIYRILWLMMV
ncbi:hypothetical protein H5T51_08510 [Candidatus Bathyarchaeota archaeon]|nr:hypothetical protein [Candidatus Bathyarchaeota archaeon]